MTVQVTLAGEETDADRVRPSTFRWCDECEEPVFVGEDHEHDLDGMMAYEKAKVRQLKEKIPEHARVETQKFVVDFHYTAVERVGVEATSERDAREQADHVRTYDAEIEEFPTLPDGIVPAPREFLDAEAEVFA